MSLRNSKWVKLGLGRHNHRSHLDVAAFAVSRLCPISPSGAEAFLTIPRLAQSARPPQCYLPGGINPGSSPFVPSALWSATGSVWRTTVMLELAASTPLLHYPSKDPRVEARPANQSRSQRSRKHPVELSNLPRKATVLRIVSWLWPRSGL